MLELAGMQTEWLELAQQEYLMQSSVAINLDDEPRLWRPGDPI